MLAHKVEMFVRVVTLVGKGEKSKQVFGWPTMFLFAILIGIIKLLTFNKLKYINGNSTKTYVSMKMRQKIVLLKLQIVIL